MTIILDDPDQLQDVYDDLAEQARNIDYSESLNEFIEVLEDSHREMFSEAKSPTGESWEPLKPATAKKKGHGTILIDRSDLWASLTGSGSSDAIRDVFQEGPQAGLSFGTSDPKSIFHILGNESRGLPQRIHVGMNEETLGELLEIVADDTVHELMEK